MPVACGNFILGTMVKRDSEFPMPLLVLITVALR
jgi:hypothetical protein